MSLFQWGQSPQALLLFPDFQPLCQRSRNVSSSLTRGVSTDTSVYSPCIYMWRQIQSEQGVACVGGGEEGTVFVTFSACRLSPQLSRLML